MPGTGFEPAHLAAPPPEDGASTNFATRAAYPTKGGGMFLFGAANIRGIGGMKQKATGFPEIRTLILMIVMIGADHNNRKDQHSNFESGRVN